MEPAETQTFNQLWCAKPIIAVHSIFAAHAFLTFPYPFSLYLSYLDPATFLSRYLARIPLSTSWEILSWPVFLNVVLAS
jgi:hypothetical protein